MAPHNLNPTPFKALVLGNLRQERARSLLALFAVGLGVAISLAVDLANATAVSSFASSVNVVARRVNLQVLGQDRGFDERTFLRVRSLAGIASASPAIEDSLVAGARAGDPESGEVLHVLGVDLLQPLAANAGEGTASGGDAFALSSRPNVDPYALIAERGAIVSRRVAKRYHLRAGGPFDAIAQGVPVRLRVSAILPDTVAGIDSSVVFVDVVTAQEIFGKIGLLDRIDCVVDPAHLGVVQRRVASVLPPGARAIEPKVRTGEIRRMLRSFALNLAALSYIAMLVGAYLIYNTVAIAVVERRPQIGILRALGATRRQIFFAFLGEGALFGVAGSILGLVLGSAFAQFSVRAVTSTVDTLYVGLHADRVVYDPLVMSKAFVAGVLLAMLSSLAPALEAAANPPALSMRSRGFERPIGKLGGRLALTGLGLLALAYGASRLPALDGIPVWGYVSGLLVIFGASLCMPLAVGAVVSAVRLLGQGLAPAARIGIANLGSSVRRASVAVASLMLAVAMMVSVAILIGSFRSTVLAWADDTLRADLFVQAVGNASEDERLPAQLASEIRSVAGVADVDTFRAISIPFRGSLTTLGASDFRTLAVRRKLRFLGGADPAVLARTLPQTKQMLVSEPFATRYGVSVGDSVPLETPSGRVAFRVAAVFNDYSSDAGVAIVDAPVFRRLYHDDSISSVAVYARRGVDLADLRTRILRRVQPERIDVQTTRELRALVIAVFNRTFAITYALYVISLAIAALSVVGTLFALVLERRTEIGLLRYVGLRSAEVRDMVLCQALCIGGLGGVAGVALGVVLSLLLIFVINRQAFGWLIELHMPYGYLLESVVLVTLVAALAGLFPARLAARIKTAEAVRSE